jgi:hypothetical protein
MNRITPSLTAAGPADFYQTHTSKPCTCWVSAVALHDGHCCMAREEDCHRAEGFAWRVSVGQSGDPLETDAAKEASQP